MALRLRELRGDGGTVASGAVVRPLGLVPAGPADRSPGVP
jgi:hypothetical protein